MVPPEERETIVISIAGRDKGGFTLLELLIVLLLLSLGSSFVLPTIEQGLKKVEIRRSALQLGAVARHLRSKAIYEGRPKGLVINPSENSYQTMDQRKVILPADVKIIKVEGGELAGDGRRIFIFFPNGSILGGEIGISGSEGTPPYIIRFSPLSGRIGVVRGDIT